MDIIQKFAELPSLIEVEGCSFELQLIVNGRVDDVRLVYQLMGVDTKSKHCQDYKMYGCWENKFQDGASQGFLFLREKIADQWDLAVAINDAELFIIENNLK